MKKGLIFVLLIAVFACKNENLPKEGDMVPLLPPLAKVEPFGDDSGLVKFTTVGSNGELLMEGFYRDNYREGVFTEFHPNKFVKSTVGYVHGKKEGQYIELDNRGQLQVRSTYHNDKLNGTSIKYNRTRIKEVKEYVDGKLDGIVEKYYPSGKIMERTHYVKGQLDGVARWYDQEGNLSIEYKYDMGELVEDDSPKEGKAEEN